MIGNFQGLLDFMRRKNAGQTHGIVELPDQTCDDHD